MGSVLGLAGAMENLEKNAVCFSKDPIPQVFDFLPGVQNIKNRMDPDYYDLVILLDCAVFYRTGLENIEEIASSFDSLLIIDHHPRTETENKSFIQGGCVEIIDSAASSSAVLVYSILKELKVNITKKIASCLLTGIFTDTGGFQHENTDAESLRAAAEFMRRGSRIDKIAKSMFNNKSVAAIKIWGKALSRVQTNKKTGMAVSYISKQDIEECGAKKEDLEGLVGVINTISDAKFSLLLSECEDNKTRGSLRSEAYKGVDVSRIAKSLGGGGHKLASGFEIEGGIKDNIGRISEIILKARLKEKM